MSRWNNPYFDESFSVRRGYNYVARGELVRKFAWAIPNDRALDLLSRNAPIVEMGAGRGYWAWVLRNGGVDIDAYDGFERGGFGYTATHVWTDVTPGGPEILSEYPKDHTLFLCWPPYDDMFAVQCLIEYRGNDIIYIGESSMGCTANATFFWMLSQIYEEVDNLEIPYWYGIHDMMHHYKKLQKYRDLVGKKLVNFLADVLIDVCYGEQKKREGYNDDYVPYYIGEVCKENQEKVFGRNPDPWDARNRRVGRLSLSE